MRSVAGIGGTWIATKAPAGRTSFEGFVVFARAGAEENSFFHRYYSMSIQVHTGDGVWFCDCSVPRSIITQFHRQSNIFPLEKWLLGQRVALTATLVPTKEAHRARGRRPAGRVM